MSACAFHDIHITSERLRAAIAMALKDAMLAVFVSMAAMASTVAIAVATTAQTSSVQKQSSNHVRSAVDTAKDDLNKSIAAVKKSSDTNAASVKKVQSDSAARAASVDKLLLENKTRADGLTSSITAVNDRWKRNIDSEVAGKLSIGPESSTIRVGPKASKLSIGGDGAEIEFGDRQSGATSASSVLHGQNGTEINPGSVGNSVYAATDPTTLRPTGHLVAGGAFASTLNGQGAAMAAPSDTARVKFFKMARGDIAEDELTVSDLSPSVVVQRRDDGTEVTLVGDVVNVMSKRGVCMPKSPTDLNPVCLTAQDISDLKDALAKTP